MAAFIYHLNEIFTSLQGEGRNSGRPVTFIRFANCNLSCPWCDTNRSERFSATVQEVLTTVMSHKVKSVIITGGEPTIQPGLSALVSELKMNGYWIGLETNGLIAPPRQDLFDYIATSPKAEFKTRYNQSTMIRKADEVRIVGVNDQISAFCRDMRQKIEATDYYISPLAKNHKMDIMTATKLISKLNEDNPPNPWKLSVQMHKLIGIK